MSSMHKIIVSLLFMFFAVIQINAETIEVKDGKKTIGTIEYSYTIGNDHPWGKPAIITIINNCDEPITIDVTLVGCGKRQTIQLGSHEDTEQSIYPGKGKTFRDIKIKVYPTY